MSNAFLKTNASNLPPVVATSYLLDDGNSAVPAANVLIVHGGVGSSTALGAANEIVINIQSVGFDWSEETADFLGESGHGYFCNNSLTVTLPSNLSLATGNSVIIYVDTTDPVIITANTGDAIQIGQNITASAGTATSTNQGDILELVYKTSDTTWHTISSVGTWTLSPP